MDGIDYNEGVITSIDRGGDGIDVGFGEQFQAAGAQAEALGPQADLGGTFLATHIKHFLLGRQGRRDLQHQRTLTNARVAREQHDRTRHDAAT